MRNILKDKWYQDIGFHVPKMMLLEIWPLNVFFGNQDNLTVIDVGGNKGYWCQAFMNTFGDRVSKYHAVEPLNSNIQVFEDRLSDNLVNYGENVCLHEMCLGPENGEVDIKFNSNDLSIASVVLDEINFGQRVMVNDKTETVEQVSLSTFCQKNNISKIDMIKLDVEGYEWDILSGAEDVIAAGTVDRIYLEFGRHQGVLGQSFKQFWDLLSKNNYHIYRQAVGRNFFGLQYIEKYHPSLEEFDSMWMILACKEKHIEQMNRPRVIGRYQPPRLGRKIGHFFK